MSTPLSPEFYNRPIVSLGESNFVVTATMPKTDYMPEGYLGLEIDQRGLPVPDNDGHASVGFMDLTSQPSDTGWASLEGLKNINPLDPNLDIRFVPRMLKHADELLSLDKRPELHFRARGGSYPSAGIIYPEEKLFESLREIRWKRRVYIEAAAQPVGESLTLDELTTLVHGLAQRDYDHNFRPEALAEGLATKLVLKALDAKATSLEATELDMLLAIQNKEAWDRIATVNYPTPEIFMAEAAEFLKRGYQKDASSKLARVVGSLATPETESIRSRYNA